MSEPIQVPLGHGLFALVDAEDAERVLAKAWHAWRKRGRPAVIYAQHTFRYGPGGRKAKTGTLWLHRFVLEAPRGVLVDHRVGRRGLRHRYGRSGRGSRCADGSARERQVTAVGDKRYSARAGGKASGASRVLGRVA